MRDAETIYILYTYLYLFIRQDVLNKKIISLNQIQVTLYVKTIRR